VTYCLSDVELLTRGCLEFRKIIINLAKVDPFKKNIIIASLCHYIFRNYLLEFEQIALIPDAGYNMFWLKYVAFKENINIMLTKKGGEKNILIN
jgi:hypothetical protein